MREPRRVLYLALEEPKWRTASRLRKLLRGTEPDGLRDLQFVYKLDSLSQLDELLTEHPSDVVIVDTLLAATKGVKHSRDLLRSDYADIDLFQQIVDKHKVTFLVIHHTRKPTSLGFNDDVDVVTGTSGTTAGIDCIWHLRSSNARQSRILSTTGRDLESEVYELRFDLTKGGFLFVTQGDEVELSAQRKEILALLASDAPHHLTPKQIGTALKKNESTVRSLLKKLYDTNLVCKTLKGHAYFVHPSTTSTEPEESLEKSLEF